MDRSQLERLAKFVGLVALLYQLTFDAMLDDAQVLALTQDVGGFAIALFALSLGFLGERDNPPPPPPPPPQIQVNITNIFVAAGGTVNIAAGTLALLRLLPPGSGLYGFLLASVFFALASWTIRARGGEKEPARVDYPYESPYEAPQELPREMPPPPPLLPIPSRVS